MYPRLLALLLVFVSGVSLAQESEKGKPDTVPDTCPVTKPSDKPFVPPYPYPPRHTITVSGTSGSVSATVGAVALTVQ
jgi:hypothetical protein